MVGKKEPPKRHEGAPRRGTQLRRQALEQSGMKPIDLCDIPVRGEGMEHPRHEVDEDDLVAQILAAGHGYLSVDDEGDRSWRIAI